MIWRKKLIFEFQCNNTLLILFQESFYKKKNDFAEKYFILPEDKQLFLELIFFKNQNILYGTEDKKLLLLYYKYSQNIF